MRYNVQNGAGFYLRRFRNLSRARQHARKLSRQGGSYWVFHENSESSSDGFRDEHSVST